MSDVLEKIERGEIPKHDIANVVLTHDDFAELLRLAKRGQQIQWIPVERKLPQNDQLVLVAKGPWFNLRTFCIDVDGDTYWFDYIHGERFELDEYPHWMELPEPPSC